MPERPPPRRRATALSYQPGAVSPKVAATGAGVIAEQIIKAAREAGVPVREDPALVAALEAIDLGAHVPADLWKAVAEALAWAYTLDAKAGRPA